LTRVTDKILTLEMLVLKTNELCNKYKEMCKFRGSYE
jgi:hypothetical protein